jgi:ABC-2 type transport system permease protein
MHIVRVFSALFKINLQQELAYRVDTLVNMLTSIVWLGWELAGLSIIFANTNNIAGWRIGDILVLFGVFRVINTFMSAVVWPNTEKFNQGIREGTLDYTFLQPMNSQFMVSFSRIVIWNAWNVFIGFGLIVAGLFATGGESPGLVNSATFLLLCTSGGLIIYSLWIALIALTFWFTKFDNNVSLMQAIMDTGRFPSMVYPPWLRAIVTFVVPIALATTVPVQALRGEIAWWQTALALGASLLAAFLSSRLWQAGVRRYSGASA